jgi:hypothetical protein
MWRGIVLLPNKSVLDMLSEELMKYAAVSEDLEITDRPRRRKRSKNKLCEPWIYFPSYRLAGMKRKEKKQDNR